MNNFKTYFTEATKKDILAGLDIMSSPIQFVYTKNEPGYYCDNSLLCREQFRLVKGDVLKVKDSKFILRRWKLPEDLIQFILSTMLSSWGSNETSYLRVPNPNDKSTWYIDFDKYIKDVTYHYGNDFDKLKNDFIEIYKEHKNGHLKESKKDILSGLDKMSKRYDNINKLADIFTINISNDFDYDKDAKIPPNAIPIEWQALPPELLAAGKIEFIADDSPGMFYTTDEMGFTFYITEPLMKNILSDTFFSNYPKKRNLKVRDLLVTYEPCLQWIEANAWDE